ncbi:MULTISPECIES: NAD(P)-binding protein [unclassified Mesotoga]|uniref:NAD(P)-binding protein n=1 Tax=unclassified Mesotoga TaxID=1184398 RepID=UPI0021AC6BD8|nr:MULTISPECIES: FAD/NAD(P)-binding protein [unclassified Mesotoga]
MARVLINGGGIVGLAAGCFARMKGFDPVILEKSSSPGGLCTSWDRGGYVSMAVFVVLHGLSQALHFTICGRTWERCLRMSTFPRNW